MIAESGMSCDCIPRGIMHCVGAGVEKPSIFQEKYG